MSYQPLDIIREFFSTVGSATQEQQQRLDKMKQACKNYPDPKACHLVLEMGAYPEISWQHNTEAHFGKELVLSRFLTLIHPAWKLLYFRYGRVGYEIAATIPSHLQQRGLCYVITVPILHSDGQYYWYDQIIIPGALNEKGELVSHLNIYRQLEAYEQLLPGPPRIYVGPDPYLPVDSLFREQRDNVLIPFLDSFLTASQVTFLQAYRKLPEVLAGRAPQRKKAIESMGMTVDNFDKMQQRIKEQIEAKFEGFPANSLFSFAKFLNTFFE